ncbi:MAG: CAAX prenyl protease-related protein [Candidatus Woesearchaeota archaeon]
MTYVYFLLLFLYLSTSFIKDLTISLLLKFLVGFLGLYFFRDYYKFKMKLKFFSIFLSIFTGLLIAFIWIYSLNIYPIFNIKIETKTNNIELFNYNIVDLILKIITFTILTPVIEEFFMRFWLIRFIISKYWQKIELGKFTLSSFLFTTLFFGFSHTLWIQGIISGILFNLLYYNRKNIESCILAHFTANFFLMIYVLITQKTIFW